MPVTFITAEDIATYMQRELDEDKASLIAEMACDELRFASGQDLDYVEDDVVRLSGNGTYELLLPQLPVWSVSEVLGVDGVALTPDDDYYVDLEMGTICTPSYATVFSRGKGNYTVTYTHGWGEFEEESLPDVQVYPKALKMLALQLAYRMYDQGLVQQETVGSYVAIYSAREANTITDREKSLLERIVGVGRTR